MSVLVTIHNRVLETLRENAIRAHRHLDIGCNEGTFTLEISKTVNAPEVYGIDILNEVLRLCPARIKTTELDVLEDRFPFPDEYFDLITAVEVIEHLPCGDNFFSESSRTLEKGGYLLITAPNLASWANRLLLLFGYQTTSVPQPSCYHTVGLPTKIRRRSCAPARIRRRELQHVCGYTLRALKDMLSIYGFRIVHEEGIPTPYANLLVSYLEKVFSRTVSLAGTLLILAEKHGTGMKDEGKPN